MTRSPYLVSIAVATNKVQEDDDRDNDKDNDNVEADEDFEKHNSIQICCTWGHSLVDGILTYYIDKEDKQATAT